MCYSVKDKKKEKKKRFFRVHVSDPFRALARSRRLFKFFFFSVGPDDEVGTENIFPSKNRRAWK